MFILIEYKTVNKSACDEFIERKSKFIGYCQPVETEEEAVEFINTIKSKHWNATHNVYAYVLNAENRMRYSDDGEPHGTAGKPILDIINGFELKDVTVVVTRYFGGILLGTGGLVRAYSKSAKDTLEAADKFLMVPGILYSVNIDYSNLARFETLLPEFDGTKEDILFEDSVIVKFSIPVSKNEEFLLKLKDTFSSAVTAQKIENKYTKQKI